MRLALEGFPLHHPCQEFVVLLLQLVQQCRNVNRLGGGQRCVQYFIHIMPNIGGPITDLIFHLDDILSSVYLQTLLLHCILAIATAVSTDLANTASIIFHFDIPACATDGTLLV